MNKHTTISLGHHYDEFVQREIETGKFHDANDVICTGLQLLEQERRTSALRQAIQKGIDSGIVEDFDPQKNLQFLKERKQRNG